MLLLSGIVAMERADKLPTLACGGPLAELINRHRSIHMPSLAENLDDNEL